MRFLLAFISIVGFAGTAHPFKQDDITYEFLLQTGNETGYCDHIPHIKKIFENYQVKVLLEFGLGYSTKYFLDHCTKVFSVEFITSGVSPHWIKYCMDLYKGQSNWIPISFFSNFSGDSSWAPYKYFGTTKFFDAEKCYASSGQMPSDDACQSEMKTFIGNLTKFNKVDLVLVDPPSLLRGALVQLLFEKAPIILACDCYSFISPQIPDTYGYRNVATPENYETIFIPKGKGTLLWIKKTDQTAELIDIMTNYAQSI